VGVFVETSSWVERALLWTVGGLLDGLEHYVTSVRSYDELVKLRRNDSSAVRAEARIAELEKENEELRSLARAVESIDGPKPLGARVVARTGSPLTKLFTLDVGSADGVRRGDGVVDKNGVVGLVLAVGRRSCDVLLLSDSSSALDVVDQRTRARGILRGDGSNERYTAKVDDFDKLRDVQPGDAIVTSGLGARFPPGTLVGNVTDAESPDDSLYLKATVRPAAELDRVEHLAVLIDRPPPRAPRLGGREDDENAVPDAGPAGAATGGASPPANRPGGSAGGASPAANRPAGSTGGASPPANRPAGSTGGASPPATGNAGSPAGAAKPAQPAAAPAPGASPKPAQPPAAGAPPAKPAQPTTPPAAPAPKPAHP
jgi:rod shape-determining protein MreC